MDLRHTIRKENKSQKEMEIIIMSREMVKPSTPTPSALHHHQLSFLDQMNGQIFSPMIYFYASTSHVRETSSNKSDILKKSLSIALTKYYPLAGRLSKCRRYIECIDKGVEIINAKVNCPLSHMMGDQTNVTIFNRLLPRHMLENAGNIPILGQLNFFDCGGLVIGMLFNHKFMDALSIINFVNYWATVSRRGGIDNMVTPRFDLARIFPPRDIPNRTFAKQENDIIAKRYMFRKDDITMLRERYATRFLYPTRVTAVSGFILSRFASATFRMTNLKRNYEVVQLVNVCNRINPPVLEPYLGNLYAHTTVTMAMEKGTVEEIFTLSEKMSNAVNKVDGDYVKIFLEELCLGNDWEKNDQIIISSLVNFPIYDANFGWGKPIWFTSGKDPMDTKVTFHPTRSGEGIEAIIKLKKDDMAKLESDEEFLAFTLPNSSAELKLSSPL